MDSFSQHMIRECEKEGITVNLIFFIIGSINNCLFRCSSVFTFSKLYFCLEIILVSAKIMSCFLHRYFITVSKLSWNVWEKMTNSCVTELKKWKTGKYRYSDYGVYLLYRYVQSEFFWLMRKSVVIENSCLTRPFWRLNI